MRATRVSDLTWEEFDRVDLRVGTVVSVREFPEARRPAFRLEVDFGSEIGILTSSAQITVHYDPEGLVGRQVIGVVNFPPKQIGPHVSQALVTGFVDSDDAVVLAVPDRPVPNGTKLS